MAVSAGVLAGVWWVTGAAPLGAGAVILLAMAAWLARPMRDE